MRYRLMDILQCPICKRPFDLRVSYREIIPVKGVSFPGCSDRCAYRSEGLASLDRREEAYRSCPECYREEVIEGVLTCVRGHAFPIRDAIPRLISKKEERQRTKRTFDVEWKVFHYGERIYGHSIEEELEDFFHRMMIDRKFLRNKTVLDAGCGIGRLASSISTMAGELVGVDFSEGVTEAGLNNRGMPTVHIVQADLMRLPFKDASFDYVYSKGVLHYVPDVPKCIAALSASVRPGGALSVTIYPKMTPFFERFNEAVRKITVRLPVRGIYGLSYLLIPFFTAAWSWSGINKRHIDWNERAHMIFNWLSSEFQNSASNRELANWFRGLGFDQLKVSPLPVGITGVKAIRT